MFKEKWALNLLDRYIIFLYWYFYIMEVISTHLKLCIVDKISIGIRTIYRFEWASTRIPIGKVIHRWKTPRKLFPVNRVNAKETRLTNPWMATGRSYPCNLRLASFQDQTHLPASRGGGFSPPTRSWFPRGRREQGYQAPQAWAPQAG